MALRHRFRKAERILHRFSVEEREKLGQLCSNIQQAETALVGGASDFLSYCADSCHGLCCKNIDVDAIIGYHDFIFILALNPHLKETITRKLKLKTAIYPADCIFLSDGKGPCLFPEDSRPQLCITTFCGDTTPFNDEILQVKRHFLKLDRFILFRKPRELGRKLISGYKRHS